MLSQIKITSMTYSMIVLVDVGSNLASKYPKEKDALIKCCKLIFH